MRWFAVRRSVTKGRRRFPGWKRWLLLLLIPCVLTVMLFIRMYPIIREYAESRARSLAELLVNETVAQVLAERADLCRSMLQVTYNDHRLLSSVMADSVAVNTVKTAVATRVLEHLDTLSSLEVGIPLGTLLGVKWFSGWGPAVHFPVSVTSRVLTTVTSTLEAVGINQSAFRVLLHVHVTLSVITPEARSSVSVDSVFPMAETVLLGEVPDNLTEVYGDDQTLLGKIFDYGTAE